MIAPGTVQNGVIVLDDGVRLPEGERVTVVVRDLAQATPQTQPLPSHSVLDIPTISLGGVLRPLTADDDLLEEMLEGRL